MTRKYHDASNDDTDTTVEQKGMYQADDQTHEIKIQTYLNQKARTSCHQQ